MFQEEYSAARPLLEESLSILLEVGYRWAVGQLLNNLGLVLRYLGEFGPARELLEESVEVRRALGDRWGVANSLSSLSNLLLHQGIFDGVREYIEESLKINVELGDRTAVAYCLEDYAGLAAVTVQPGTALKLAGAAKKLREEIGSPLPQGEQAALDKLLAPARQALDEASQAEAWEAGEAMAPEAAIAYAQGA
jgi:tetratricopeptide (TPR) repeat protein